MKKYCKYCHKETHHIKETERSQPDDPVTYYICTECGNFDL
jgi:hypothetical protein